jgi:hypothetical protein
VGRARRGWGRDGLARGVRAEATVRYDWYGCPIPSSWTPPRPPDPPLSRIALALARRRLRERWPIRPPGTAPARHRRRRLGATPPSP